MCELELKDPSRTIEPTLILDRQPSKRNASESSAAGFPSYASACSLNHLPSIPEDEELCYNEPDLPVRKVKRLSKYSNNHENTLICKIQEEKLWEKLMHLDNWPKAEKPLKRKLSNTIYEILDSIVTSTLNFSISSVSLR